ncbi:MAG TPA: glycosyl transferase [Deltaproteobacteria bacterium]|nr:glycosyl transferase [Deltaproteobacteria bacterium]
MKFQEDNPGGITRADIVVGIPSYNEAAGIAGPAEQAAIGLKEYFPDMTCVLVNCDNTSSDGTSRAFMDAPSHGIPKIAIYTPRGIRGKGNNLKNLFRKVLELDAKAAVVIEGNLKSVTPMWIKNLAGPIFKDFAFVSPLYVRHKYDGTITNNIAYPLTRCLYGRRVRQPIGGDCAFSGTMAGVFLKSPLWDEDVGQFGIDIWMSTVAVNEGLPICQAFLGRPKLSTTKPRDPALDVGTMFRYMVITLFNLMEAFEHKWITTKWSKPTAIFGFDTTDVEQPPDLRVTRDRLYMKFREGFNAYWDLYRTLFSSENLQKVREIASLDMDHFEMPVPVWARILFDCALCYHRKLIDRTRLIEVLVPLFYGMTLSFVNKTEGMSSQQAEEFLEDMCLVFEQSKPYLTYRWSQ